MSCIARCALVVIITVQIHFLFELFQKAEGINKRPMLCLMAISQASNPSADPRDEGNDVNIPIFNMVSSHRHL
jgi:hypothetical protein